MDDECTSRTLALLGAEGLSALANASVLIVGVGGVGGWCAEALARTGVGRLTIVDDDIVAPSNLNRQCAATRDTIGSVKVQAMAARLNAVNSDCRVTAIRARFPDAAVRVGDFDAVVDAIDSVDAKAELVLACSEAQVPLVSSMGAALRMNPTQVRVTCFDQVAGDGLARALRMRFKKLGRQPGGFSAVWSAEPPIKSEVRGSVMPVVATFGMALAAEVIRILGKGKIRK